MKIIDVPQTGKLGLTVTYPGRTGLIRRSWVVPANPQTAEQLVVRSRLANTATAYDALTESQQDAWIAAAAQEQSRPTLGQSGPLTGLQLYVKINANLSLAGEAAVTTPPAKPAFTPLPITALTLTNAGGVLAVKLACSDDLPINVMVFAGAPQNSGTRRPITLNCLGGAPAVSGGFSVITTLWTAKFGDAAAGQRLFVRCHEINNGWAGPSLAVTALVPAES
jgi:hypothetical protein